MNWTGGSLSRSRKQNANLNVIQKKHFAKVRGQLLNGRPPPPRLDVSIFQGLQQDGKVHSPMVSTSTRHHERQRSQMTLDEYENIRPIVRQLQSLRPRHARRKTPSPPIEPQPPSQSAEPNQSSSTQFTQAKSRTQTNPYRGSSRSTRSDFGATGFPPAIDELEVKRRELLGTSDWVGLRKIKPLKIQFPDAEDRDLIGKRRRVDTDQNRAVGAIPAPTQNWRPVSNAYEKLNMRRANPSMLSSPSGISIHIGSSDHSSLQKVRQDSRRRQESDHDARKSDEMLFDDQGSARDAMRKEGSTQDSFRQSEHASDEMLFDREWSGIASPLNVEPAIDSCQHPHHPSDQSPMIIHPTASTMSSGFETEYSDELQHAGEVLCDPRIASVGSALDCSVPVVNERPFEYARTILRGPKPEHSIDHRRDSNKINPSGQNEGDQFVEQTAPERTKRPLQTDQLNAVERFTSQSQTAPQGKQTLERSFAKATAQELAELFPCKETFEEISQKVNHGRHLDRIQGAGKPESIGKDSQPENNKRDQIPKSTEQAQDHIAEAQNQQGTPSQTLQPSSSPSKDPIPVTTKTLSNTPTPAPTITNPNPQTQHLVSQPVDPTREDDELIWRTFVFGTDSPNDDGWIFDRTAPKTSPPPLPTLRVESSSPIPTTNPQNQTSNQSSPLQQTQPSLLAEASSSSLNSTREQAPTSPPHSSSPTRALPLPSSLNLPPSLSSHADPHPSTSPPKTQHSTQAQPAISSDELALSSSPRPAVVFRRPRRYVGDSASPMGAQPIRLGVREKKKGRKRDHEGEEKGDGEAYGERLKGRKKRRGEWRGEVREVMEEVGEGEADEIVDD